MFGILRLRRRLPEDSILVRVATAATVLVAVLAVAEQEELTSQAIVAGVAMGVGSWFSYRRRHVSNWWVKALITVLVLAVTRTFFRGLLENPYDPRLPLIRLFLWLQALHSFDLPTRKDLKYSLASAVVLIAVAAVFARDMTFGTFLVAFTLVASVAVVTMAGSGFRLSVTSVAASSVLLGLGVVLAGAVAFAAIPHEQGLRARWLPISARLAQSLRLHDRIINPAYPLGPGRDPDRAPPPFNPNGYVGFSTYVDLRLRGILSDDLGMRVRTTRPALWRGLAFDEYTGRGWQMQDRAVEEYAADGERILPRFNADEPWPVGSEQTIQTFYIEAQQPNVIFGAYRPFEVYFPAGSIGVDRYAGLRSSIPLERGTIYSVISRVPNPTPRLLARAESVYPDTIRTRYLQLPTIPARVRALATRLTEDLTSPYERAVAVNRYLLSGYTYNLQAPLLPTGADAVDHFLFDSKQGACETFASAMAVLLRAAGVPARLVTGYTSGQYNILTGYYEVRNSDAHAWVEVYLPRVGWIEFEPTPGFAPPEVLVREPAGSWLARDAVVWAFRIAESGARSVLAGLGSLHIVSGPGFPASTGGLLILATVLVLVRHFGSRGNNRVQSESIRDVYVQMSTALARRGMARTPAVTPREFATGIPSALRPFVATITETFEADRYGHRHVSPGQYVQSRDAYSRLCEALRHRRRRHPG